MKLNKDEEDFLFHQKNQGDTQENLINYYRKERKKGIPHQYIVGKVVFHDLCLKVNSNCLIPRLESELLVEKALERFPLEGKVLDLCTGSGALGLAIKKLRPKLDVTLVDISEEAIALAKENAKTNKLDVEIIRSDFLYGLGNRKFDAIICNPPYISQQEYDHLELSVKHYEPKIALLGGEDGLKFYKLLAKQAHNFLLRQSVMCLEIGKDQANAVSSLFSEKIWSKKEVEKDYSSHDRFFFLEKRNQEL